MVFENRSVQVVQEDHEKSSNVATGQKMVFRGALKNTASYLIVYRSANLTLVCLPEKHGKANNICNRKTAKWVAKPI
jgi:hypothetical protein